MEDKISIFCHTQRSFAEEIYKRLGKGYNIALDLYSEFFRNGKFLFEVQPQAFSLAKAIADSVYVPDLVFTKELVSEDSIKYCLRNLDGSESELVVLPMEYGTTLCISSQIGCARNCLFCTTGSMGFIRNLSVEEIIAEVMFAKFQKGHDIKNIVFMGMGEPLDNFENLTKVVPILMDQKGLGLAPRKITISTSGNVPGIHRLIEEKDLNVQLAVSVNAHNDEARSYLMPINKIWNMKELKEAMVAFNKAKNREILVEYVLIKDLNDSTSAANDLLSYLQGVEAKVNVIPYNPGKNNGLQAPDPENVDSFLKILRDNGLRVFLRGSKGQNIMAACGQLGRIYTS